MANKKIQIKNANGDLLYPRTTLDNIVSAVGSTVSVRRYEFDNTY